MARVAFDRARREQLAARLVRQLAEEFEVEIAPMDGQRLVDMLTESLGAAFYNQGLRDAQAAIQARVDEIGETIAGLELPEPR